MRYDSDMSIVFLSHVRDPIPWKAVLQKHFPQLEFYLPDEVVDPDTIRYALVWAYPTGALKPYRNLQLIQTLGAGVDQILNDPDRPSNVPVARLEDAGLATQMAQYVSHYVLRYHRQFDSIEAESSWSKWIPAEYKGRVGILGAGILGGACAKALLALGYSVSCWRNRLLSMEGVNVFTGADGLNALLQQTDILVCLLPLTKKTNRILSAKNLSQMPKGGVLINVGRGAHLDEEALIPLLDCGQLRHAVLDVFDTEPLPDDHPFWSHPQITVTPHISALTVAEFAEGQVLDNIQRCETGQSPQHLVSPERGY